LILQVHPTRIELDNKIFGMQHYSELYGDEIHQFTHKIIEKYC